MTAAGNSINDNIIENLKIVSDILDELESRSIKDIFDDVTEGIIDVKKDIDFDNIIPADITPFIPPSEPVDPFIDPIIPEPSDPIEPTKPPDTDDTTIDKDLILTPLSDTKIKRDDFENYLDNKKLWDEWGKEVYDFPFLEMTDHELENYLMHKQLWEQMSSEDRKDFPEYMSEYNKAIREKYGFEDEHDYHALKDLYDKFTTLEEAKVFNQALRKELDIDDLYGYEELKDLWDVYKRIGGYKDGGVNLKPGMYPLHGTSDSVETIFNATQGKKLFNIIDNLPKEWLNMNRFIPNAFNTPNLATATNDNNIDIKFDNLINVEGNVDNNTIPKIKNVAEQVFDKFNEQLRRNGLKRKI